jgi:hypothetical protein
MVSKLEFNFYYAKANYIKKVVVDDYDNLTISDFLLKALKEYNSQNPNSAIVEECEYYKIKLAKKSGKPDTDLPAISPELVVKESNWFNFSIALDKDHFLFGPPENVVSNVKTVSESSDITNNKKDKENFLQTKPVTKSNNQVEIQENQGGICCCLMACFGKKKK